MEVCAFLGNEICPILEMFFFESISIPKHVQLKLLDLILLYVYLFFSSCWLSNWYWSLPRTEERIARGTDRRLRQATLGSLLLRRCLAIRHVTAVRPAAHRWLHGTNRHRPGLHVPDLHVVDASRGEDSGATQFWDDAVATELRSWTAEGTKLKTRLKSPAHDFVPSISNNFGNFCYSFLVGQ